MNWYRHPDTIDRLAAEYVMGLMQPAVKRRFETVMRQRHDVTLAVQDWSERTLPWAMALPEASPSPATWAAIERHITPHPAAPASSPRHWWQRWLAPIPAGALAMGLVVGMAVPLVWNGYQQAQSEMQLPQSYVGVLATPQGKPGLIVSSLRLGHTVDIKQISEVAVPTGHSLYLWRIDKAGTITPLGPIPAPQHKLAHVTLPEAAEKAFFPAVELAVSIEPSGSRPATPSQAFVYRGLCGKLWK
jgi:anti-sigma-K factor RskA